MNIVAWNHGCLQALGNTNLIQPRNIGVYLTTYKSFTFINVTIEYLSRNTNF